MSAPGNPAAYVYLMQMGEYYKIGQTIDVTVRFMTLDVGPIPLRLVHSFASHNSLTDELSLHQRFAAKRVRKEWFRLDPEDVEFICKITGVPKEQEVKIPLSAYTVAKTKNYWVEKRERFAAYLCELANEAGITPVELAEKTGISLQSIERILAGKRVVGRKQLNALNRVLRPEE